MATAPSASLLQFVARFLTTDPDVTPTFLMKNWPTWIPVPRSWMDALFLTLLMAGMQIGIGYLWQLLSFLIHLQPRLVYLFGVMALLSPIALIAFLHHWLHGFLDRLVPDTQTPDVGKVEGFFPGLMSWWEGLYGWLVSVLSLIVGFAILATIAPSVSMLNWVLAWSQGHLFPIIPTLVRVVIAAYLYHMEFLVRQHLLSVGSTSR